VAQALGRKQRGAGDFACVGLAIGKAVDAVGAVMHHQRGHLDARTHGRRLELRHEDALARLHAALHGSTRLLTQAEHMRKQACVLARGSRWRQQHQFRSGQAAAHRPGRGIRGQ